MKPLSPTSLLIAPALLALTWPAPSQVSSGQFAGPLTGVGGGAGPTFPGPSPTGFDRPRIAVALAPGTDPALLSVAGGQVTAQFGDGLPMSLGGPGHLVELAFPTQSQAQAGLAKLRNLPWVQFSEPVRQALPPEIGSCGALVGPQQCTAAFFDSGPSLPKYAQQPALPAIALGADTAAAPGGYSLVAVIDTGIDPTHPLLAGRVLLPGFDYTRGTVGGWDIPDAADNDHDGLVDEAFGHGTHVAGLITLVDPNAKLVSYRVLDSDGIGNSFAVAQAIYRATEEGAAVINLSLSLAGPSGAVEEALEHADEAGVAIFASAGNGGVEGVLYPARYEEATAVAALDAGDKKADFSSFGPEVEIVAPGVDLYSAMPLGQYAWWSGSSMATALASGANSRLLSHKPGLGTAGQDDDDLLAPPQIVNQSLIETAISVDSQNPAYSGKLGKGRVHLSAAALNLLAPGNGDDGDDGDDN